jgi:hypothetical protein
MPLLVSAFPLCCGAQIISNFASWNVTEKSFKTEIGAIIARSPCNFFAILNQSQLKPFDKWLQDVGFQIIGANVNNPVHNSKIFMYLYVSKDNLTRHNGELKPYDLTMDHTPEQIALIKRSDDKFPEVKLTENTKNYLQDAQDNVRIAFFNANKEGLTKQEIAEYEEWYKNLLTMRQERQRKQQELAKKQQEEYMKKVLAEQERIRAIREQEKLDRERRNQERAERLKNRAETVGIELKTPQQKAAETRAFNIAAAKEAVRQGLRDFLDSNGRYVHARNYLDPYAITRW